MNSYAPIDTAAEEDSPQTRSQKSKRTNISRRRMRYDRAADHSTSNSKTVDGDDAKEGINWQAIGQILMDFEFISRASHADTVDAVNECLDVLEDFCAEEDILNDMDLRDALCASHCNVKDDGTILCRFCHAI